MKKLMTAAALMALISAPAFAAGDAEAGKAKSAVCAACHGAEGISAMDIYPNLAGQKAAYTAKQLKAFRDGERNDPIMAPMAKPLSDQDIEDLAAYFASL
ncbi:cytochrome C [Zobellella endophytica]|uniref:Cytochrome C n=1 Tax=Zobellella endophytica TaxID=2116700 RepID=A0A2P7R4M0_9GAMM|nr:cytochrome c [Zobellella endophytica]PSJ45145.1 cytochrome C [Zobellella endophytica]